MATTSGGRRRAAVVYGSTSGHALTVWGALVLLAGGGLSGCAAIGVDAAYSAMFRTTFVDLATVPEAERAQLAAMPVLQAPSSAFHTMGSVTGLACSLSLAPLIPRFHWTPALSEANGQTPQDVALRQMKFKALRQGADAVLSPSCRHHEWVDWGNNCFESWSCTAEALRRVAGPERRD